MKKCPKCQIVKPLDSFYPNKAAKDGLSSWCGVCSNRKKRERQKADPVAQKERKAREYVRQAVRAGRLIKPERCSQCGGTGDIQGHHEDYNKPLEVVWLCVECHKYAHNKEILKRLQSAAGMLSVLALGPDAAV